MKRRALSAGLAAAIAIAGVSAEARMHAPYRGHRIVASGAAPLDGFTTPSAAYSFRKLRSAYAGPAIRLRRASDNAEQDINFLGFTGFTGAPIDTAQANAHCAATTCTVVTRYDQSGNARHITQATAANQPAFIFNCQNGLPCLRATDSAQILQSAAGGLTTASPISIGSVAIRNSGTALCRSLYVFFNQLYASPGGGSWTLQADTTLSVTAADAQWHALLGVINGAATVLRADATEVTGTMAATAGVIDSIQAPIGPAAGTTCSHGEDILWSGYGLTAPERAALTANQKSFWGIP